jgi:hypothetical protein
VILFPRSTRRCEPETLFGCGLSHIVTSKVTIKSRRAQVLREDDVRCYEGLLSRLRASNRKMWRFVDLHAS